MANEKRDGTEIKDVVEQFLREPNIGVFATVGRAGQPHASPVWYGYTDGVFTVLVERRSQKFRDVEANPKVALALDQRGSDPGQYPLTNVSAEGVAEIIPNVSEEMMFDVARRYEGEEGGKTYVENSDLTVLVAIRFRPQKVVAYRATTKLL